MQASENLHKSGRAKFAIGSLHWGVGPNLVRSFQSLWEIAMVSDGRSGHAQGCEGHSAQWCDEAHASMPTTLGSSLAKNASTRRRFNCWRRTTFAFRVDAVHLKHRLGNVRTDGRDRLHPGTSEL